MSEKEPEYMAIVRNIEKQLLKNNRIEADKKKTLLKEISDIKTRPKQERPVSKIHHFPKLSETEVLSLYSENGISPAKYQASLVMIFERTTNRFLSILREPNDWWFASTWAFPCGLIEQGETPKQAAIRETFEETALSLREDDIQYIATYYDTTSDCLVYVHKTYIEDVAKVTVSQEHSGFMWCNRKLLEKITTNEDLISPNMKNILDWTI